MKITEDLLLGKLLYGESVYEGSEIGNLRPVLCTNSPRPGTAQSFCQFTDGTYHPWQPHRHRTNPKITNSKVARHKVFNEDELEFVLAYEELGDLSLDSLQVLAEEHDRCTFVVDGISFLNLFKQLAAFTGNFKYHSNTYNTENGFAKLPQNAIFTVSMYKLHTFMFDLYGNKPKGCGIAFEILDKRNSVTFPQISIGYYILMTDTYEGIFYVDGKARIRLQSTDFKFKYQYFKDILTLCEEKRVEKSKPYTLEEHRLKDWADAPSPGKHPRAYAKAPGVGFSKAEQARIQFDKEMQAQRDINRLRGLPKNPSKPVQYVKPYQNMHKKEMYAKMYGGSMPKKHEEVALDEDYLFEGAVAQKEKKAPAFKADIKKNLYPSIKESASMMDQELFGEPLPEIDDMEANLVGITAELDSIASELHIDTKKARQIMQEMTSANSIWGPELSVEEDVVDADFKEPVSADKKPLGSGKAMSKKPMKKSVSQPYIATSTTSYNSNWGRSSAFYTYTNTK